MVGVVAADQATKLWALANLTEHVPQPVWSDFLMFSLVFNEGGAMGTRLGPSTYYLVMALLVLPFVFYFIYQNRRLAAVSVPLSFIAGGAIGNLIDRVRLGKVVDFIDVDFFDISIGSFNLHRWWTFNIADSAISCAIVFLLIHMLMHRTDLVPDDSAPATPDPEDRPSV